jgi:hypothetical protein
MPTRLTTRRLLLVAALLALLPAAPWMSPAQANTLPSPLSDLATAEPVPDIEQPDVSRMPVREGSLAGATPIGEHVATATGGGTVWAVGERDATRIHAWDGTSLARQSGIAVTGGRLRGLAYYRGELYVGDQAYGNIKIYRPDGSERPPLRLLGVPSALRVVDEVQKARKVYVAEQLQLSGLDVAWQEVWVTLAGSAGGRVVMALDALTGAPKAVTFHLARYDCGALTGKLLTANGSPVDTADCDAAQNNGAQVVGACAVTPEMAQRWLEYGVPLGDVQIHQEECDFRLRRDTPLGVDVWDVSVSPEMDAVISGCRVIRRNAMVTAASAQDIDLTRDVFVEAATGAGTGCSEVRQSGGTDAVWGMRWLLQAERDDAEIPGRYVREFPLTSLTTTTPPVATIGANARGWQLNPPGAGSVPSDIAYQKREVRIDWRGDLTRGEWQHGNRCAEYIVSDADIFVVNGGGSRYYELARNFQKIEVLLDGQVVEFTQNGVAMTSSTSPNGTLCLNTNAHRSGQRKLTLRAYVNSGTKVVTQSNDTLRLDHDAPTGSVSDPGRFVTGSIRLTGSLADAHAGPRDRQLEVAPAGGAWRDLCPTQTPAAGQDYACDWDTRTVSDGRYELRSRLRDQVTEPFGGANVGHSPGRSTFVDNTAPGLRVSGEARDRADLAPIYDDESPAMTIDATDAGSGARRVELFVDGVLRDSASTGCDAGGCSLTPTFALNPASYGDGQHEVRVVAHDGVGHTVQDVWTVDVELLFTPDEDPTPENRASLALDTPEEAEAIPTLLDDPTLPVMLAIPDDAIDPASPKFDATKFLDCTGDDERPNFQTYSLGESFEGLAVTARIRNCEPPKPPWPYRANFVSHIYGDCELSETSGEGPHCAPPLEIQSWPLCERNPQRYLEGQQGSPLLSGAAAEEELTIRGVPAAIYDEGQVLEVYTGTTTVAIFGDDRAQVRRAAENLVRVQLPSALDTADPTGITTTDPSAALANPMPGGTNNTAPCANTARYVTEG